MILRVLAVVAVLVLVGCLLLAMRQRTMQQAQKEERVESLASETLEYVMPPGQDPAVLAAALKKEGYTAVGETLTGAAPTVLVDVPRGRDSERAHVRAVIKNLRTTGFEGAPLEVDEVTFEDER